MPRFTTPSKRETTTEIDEDFNFELSIIVMAKKTGLTFGELKHMSMQEFIDFVEMHVGDDSSSKDATQKDIDYFYSHM